MRMWNVNPKIMCRKHLLGEHAETHMFVGSIKKNKSLIGYIRNNLFDAATLIERHDKLAEEMISRGYKHKTPIEEIKKNSTPINESASLIDLISRCEECKSNFVKEGKRKINQEYLKSVRCGA